MKTCVAHGFPCFLWRYSCNDATGKDIDIAETQRFSMIQIYVAKCEKIAEMHLQKHFEILQCI